MRSVLVALPVAAFAGLVSYASDTARWSALVLHAEPVLLAALAVAAYAAWSRRRRAVAVGLLLGALAGFVLVRVPARATRPFEGSPPWARTIQGCVAALPAPRAEVDVLQWTVGAATPLSAVRAGVAVIEPHVLVVFDLPDAGVLEELVALRGGEYHFEPPTPGTTGFGVWTPGEFSLCDGEETWTDVAEAPAYRLFFVGLGEDVTFPLLVTRFPDPLTTPDWAARMDTRARRVDALLDALASPLTVVIADAPVTSTYRHLFAELAAVGLHAVPTPPNFPARLGRVPLLPLHAYDRAWTGVGWSTVASKRVAVRGGTRAPVWSRLSPTERGTASAPRSDGPPTSGR